jgi:hypothetical protein
VLLDTDKRGIHHGVCMVSIASEMFANPFPDTAFRPAAVAAVPMLPIAKPLGQIAPRHTCPVAGQHGLSKQAVVFGCDPNRLCSTRPQMLDLIPLIIP